MRKKRYGGTCVEKGLKRREFKKRRELACWKRIGISVFRKAHGKFAESKHMPCPSESVLYLLFIVSSFSLFREHSLGYRKQFQFEKFKYPSLGSGSGGGRRGMCMLEKKIEGNESGRWREWKTRNWRRERKKKDREKHRGFVKVVGISNFPLIWNIRILLSMVLAARKLATLSKATLSPQLLHPRLESSPLPPLLRSASISAFTSRLVSSVFHLRFSPSFSLEIRELVSFRDNFPPSFVNS